MNHNEIYRKELTLAQRKLVERYEWAIEPNIIFYNPDCEINYDLEEENVQLYLRLTTCSFGLNEEFEIRTLSGGPAETLSLFDSLYSKRKIQEFYNRDRKNNTPSPEFWRVYEHALADLKKVIMIVGRDSFINFSEKTKNQWIQNDIRPFMALGTITTNDIYCVSIDGRLRFCRLYAGKPVDYEKGNAGIVELSHESGHLLYWRDAINSYGAEFIPFKTASHWMYPALPSEATDIF